MLTIHFKNTSETAWPLGRLRFWFSLEFFQKTGYFINVFIKTFVALFYLVLYHTFTILSRIFTYFILPIEISNISLYPLHHLIAAQNIKKQPFLRIAVSYLPLFSSLCNNVLHTLFIRSSLSTYCSCAKNPASAHAKLASIPYSISLTLLSFFLTNLANY